jgi:hypothetical protein
MCGLSRNKADGAALNAWGKHNDNWEINPLRCPMYLQWLAKNNIGSHVVADGAVAGDEMPVAWPNDAQQALDLFHKERILREMQKLMRLADPEKMHALMLAAMPGDSFVNKSQTSISLTNLDILLTNLDILLLSAESGSHDLLN